MRELGHRGGKARRQGAAEQLPAPERESLRQHLRDKLDHATVVEAVQRSLAGGNESARVAAVKFLADLELYRKDGDECPRCAAKLGRVSRLFRSDLPHRLMERMENTVSKGEPESTGT